MLTMFSGARWLIDQLNKLGFCVSMEEVTRYKLSVMMYDSYDNEDNVDHNVKTSDGKGSLHGMGIISSTTNKFGPSYPSKLTPIEQNKLRKVNDVISHQGIPIKSYILSSTTGLSKLVFKERCTLDVIREFHTSNQLDILWNTAIFLRNSGCRPNWSGYDPGL